MRKLLIMLLLIPFVTFAQEEEPPLAFPILENDTTLEDAMEGNATARMYAFAASQGDRVSISMTSTDEDSGLDSMLVLLDSTGKAITFDDDSGGLSNALIDSFELPADGMYFVLATDATSLLSPDPMETSAPYELYIRGITPPEDEPEPFEIETIKKGGEKRGEISIVEPAHLYLLTVEEGETINIDLQTDLDTILYVFNAEGERVALNDDAPDGGYHSALPNLELEPGNYLIVAATFDFAFLAQSGMDQSGEFILRVR